MGQQVNYNGIIHNFPDEATPDMIKKALGISSGNNSNEGMQKNESNSFGGYFTQNRNRPEQQEFNKTMKKLSQSKTYKNFGLGVAQGIANTPSDVINLPIQLGNYLNKTDAPMLPRFNFAPESGESTAGEIISGLLPIGGALPKAYKSIKELQEAVSPKINNLISPVRKEASKDFSSLKNLIQNLSPKNLAYKIQNEHDKLLNQSSDLYDFVKNEVNPRGVDKINISKDILNQSKKYLPDTDKVRKLIDNAQGGDYEALHELQSDLGKKGRKALGSDLYSETNQGEEMLDLREKINKSIRDRFKEYGHEDLVKLLDEARDKYRKLKETYYAHPTIAKLVHPETRIIPRNPLTALTEESERTKPLFSEHPDIKEAVKRIEKLKKIGKVSLAATLPIIGEELIRRR